MPDTIYLIPPLFIVVLAIFFGFWRLNTRGTKAAIVSVVRVLVYGTIVMFLLIVLIGGLFLALYYSGGGH